MMMMMIDDTPPRRTFLLKIFFFSLFFPYILRDTICIPAKFFLVTQRPIFGERKKEAAHILRKPLKKKNFKEPPRVRM